MGDPELNVNDKGHGSFIIKDEEEVVAEMVVAISGDNLIVYHTEVAQKMEGQGLAKILLNTMVTYARANHLKVVPLCPYVHAQFKRHPKDFEDIWQKVDGEN